MAAAVGGDGKKHSTRIDMTPMVDLGFLLLTFFVLTTTLAQPTVMPIIVPADKEKEPKEQTPEDKVSEEKVLFLLVAGKDRVYWYQTKKEDDVDLNMTNYAPKGLRKTVRKKKNNPQMLKKFATKDDPNPLIVLIKMTDDASYKNMVDVLDEMNITDQKKYMLLEAEQREIEMIRDYEKDNDLSNSVPKSMEKYNMSASAQ